MISIFFYIWSSVLKDYYLRSALLIVSGLFIDTQSRFMISVVDITL